MLNSELCKPYNRMKTAHYQQQFFSVLCIKVNSLVEKNWSRATINGIEGACVGFSDDIVIEGSPTGIGFWCYVPENMPDLWVCICIMDTNGAYGKNAGMETGVCQKNASGNIVCGPIYVGRRKGISDLFWFPLLRSGSGGSIFSLHVLLRYDKKDSDS